jgi:hypothetical protein
MLWFVYVLNFLDRQLMSILAKPIQDSLHVTDSQLGLIGGLYFAMFYCFIAIPVGWLADRTNRVAVLSLACGIWSAATGLRPVAQLRQFAVSRMTVGFGEAGGVPPSYAIISDYFPPARRAARRWASTISARRSARRWASPSARPSRRPSTGATPSCCWARSGRRRRPAVDRQGAAARRPGRPAPASRREGRLLVDLKMFFSRPTLVLAALGSGATQFVTYGLGNFTTLFLMREKGMAWARSPSGTPWWSGSA